VRKFDAIYVAIGRFVVEWSGLEYCLDLLVLSARDRSTQLEIPHQIGEKLRFLRDSVKSRPELADYAKAINELVDEVLIMKEDRHDFVHGAVIHMAEESRPFTITLHRVLQPRKQARRPPLKATARQINLAADNACRLADKILDTAEAVNKARRPTA
jgi:hypothetical protein